MEFILQKRNGLLRCNSLVLFHGWVLEVQEASESIVPPLQLNLGSALDILENL